MTKQHNLNVRLIFLSVLLTFIMGLLPAFVHAQNAQDASSSSEIFNGSAQSDFQNAGYQQSGGSAATTAGGSAEVLKQPGDGGTIEVSGAPANQTVTEPAMSRTAKAWFTFIFVVSGGGLILVAIYSKRAKARQAVNEAAFAEVVAKEAKPKSKAKTAKAAETTKETKTSEKVPKKKKTAKKKKKHHR